MMKRKHRVVSEIMIHANQVLIILGKTERTELHRTYPVLPLESCDGKCRFTAVRGKVSQQLMDETGLHTLNTAGHRHIIKCV